jgi:hypothetical protein
MQMDCDARKLWIDFSDQVDGLIKQDGPYYSIRGLASKAAEHAARLAATTARFEFTKAKEIQSEDMKRGITLARNYLDESLRIREAAAVDKDMQLAERLLRWLHDSWDEPQGLISLPDVYQTAPIRAIRAKKRAQEIINILVNHGWLVPHDPCKVGGIPRRDVWQIVREEAR